MFSNKLAITWRLFGDSGDYLAILEVIGVLLGHNRVTDTHYPCASVTSVQSVFYRTPPIIDDDKKPQINADERRSIALFHSEECKAEHEDLNRSMGKNETTINTELVRTETNSGYSNFGGNSR